MSNNPLVLVGHHCFLLQNVNTISFFVFFVFVCFCTEIYFFCFVKGAHIDVVKELCENWKANSNALSGEGTTPLFHAACKGNTRECRYLIEEAGADVNGGDPEGWRPIHGAVYHTRADTVEYLVSKGADVTVHNKKYMKGVLFCVWIVYYCMFSLLF